MRLRLSSKIILLTLMVLAFSTSISSAPADLGLTLPNIDIKVGSSEQNLTPAITIFLIITVLSLAPSFLMLMTSFTRIAVVLSFVKQAIGARQAPPNQVVVALALFLTILIMFPVFSNVYNKAIVPYNSGTIGYEKAVERTWNEFKTFMLREIVNHKNQDNIYMLAQSTNIEIKDINDTPFQVLIPAFALSELEISFKMGILIYLPFIIVDMVVASILLSMGMMMIPPVMISMPFKILLFVLVNGWDLLIGSLVRSFSGG